MSHFINTNMIFVLIRQGSIGFICIGFGRHMTEQRLSEQMNVPLILVVLQAEFCTQEQ